MALESGNTVLELGSWKSRTWTRTRTWTQIFAHARWWD